MAINQAQQKVRETGDLSVPLAIRNSPTKLMKDLDYGKGYKYAHDHGGNFADMEFLPDEIKGTRFYDPGQNPREAELRIFLKKLWGKKYDY
jgi:putative ATPase